MKAVVKTAPGVGNVELKEMPEPHPGPKEVKLRVKAAGLCGTDLHIYHDHYKNNPPVILGHEFCGDVVEVGAEVENVKVGQRIVANPTAGKTCGKCRYCLTGHFFMCIDRAALGSGLDGGFAPYAVAKDDIVYQLPEHMSYEAGSLCEPFACAFQAVNEITVVEPGEVVLVTGAGPMGIMCAKLAELSGATVIQTGLDSDAKRLEKSKQLGIQHTLNVQKEDLGELVKSLTNGYGCDVVVECAGAQASIQDSLELIRPLGRFSQVGLPGERVLVDMDIIVKKQLYFRGSITHNAQTWENIMEFLGNKTVDLGIFISDVLPLSDWEVAFDNMAHQRTLKTILIP